MGAGGTDEVPLQRRRLDVNHDAGPGDVVFGVRSLAHAIVAVATIREGGRPGQSRHRPPRMACHRRLPRRRALLLATSSTLVPPRRRSPQRPAPSRVGPRDLRARACRALRRCGGSHRCREVTSSSGPVLLERDGAVARFDMGEYACLRSCLRESLTEGWSAGSGRWAEAAALYHSLPTVSARAATWDPGSGFLPLKGPGRWAPVEALAMLMWAVPVYRAAIHLAEVQPWAGEEWLPRLTAPPAQVRRLGSRLDELAP